MNSSHDNVCGWTAETVGMSYEILDRMQRAVAKVRERLLRATAALNQVGVPYAVVGGNAVASWVANTRYPYPEIVMRKLLLTALVCVVWMGTVQSRAEEPRAIVEKAIH